MPEVTRQSRPSLTAIIKAARPEHLPSPKLPRPLPSTLLRIRFMATHHLQSALRVRPDCLLASQLFQVRRRFPAPPSHSPAPAPLPCELLRQATQTITPRRMSIELSMSPRHQPRSR